MKYLMVVFKYLKNKYVIAFIVFILWVTVIDKNNIFKGRQVRQDLKELEAQKSKIIEETIKDSVAVDQLRRNPAYLEQFAREEYGMKKDNEDVYVIVKKPAPADQKKP